MPTDTQPFFTGKQLLIFGCGYLGTLIARQALARRMRVIALTRNPQKAAVLRAEGIEAIVADLATPDWHELVPREMDYVLNCVSSGAAGTGANSSGPHRSSNGGPLAEPNADPLARLRRSYLAGMQSLVEWTAQSPRIGTCVYTSSTGVYPQGDGARVDEDSPLATPAHDSRSGILSATESALRKNCVAQRWFILRLAGLYGPGRTHLLDQVRDGAAALPGSGEPHLNLTHVEDAAAAVWAAFAAPAAFANRAYNVADDFPAPKAEVVAWLAAQLGQPAPRFDPARATLRRRVVPDRVILNHRLKRELGWQPRYPSYREGYASLLSR
ncbi:hypothetical protein AXK11_04180 [Cephaloticoccus primus]|uniref:NAD-dependent epimerase/dehydratase domain-containing protein n=1 Tax=Cephaloticoccus primus TaxID=1548207 RepID=A0A139SPW9_9BACT|nr:NAD-dependent epimerase/dehydratase family protein [Cephaloticoccus primus]KXU36554.1 hypothetical protein AXK11_04180 [Cephaloticoccus primus]